MGNLISLSSAEKTQKQFILVLGSNDQCWQKLKEQFANNNSLVISYYFFDQIDWLRRTGMLQDYSACLLMGTEDVLGEDRQKLTSLAQKLPLVLIKRADNVYDFSLERLCEDTLSQDAFLSLDVTHYLHRCVRRFAGVQERFLKRIQPDTTVCQSPVTDIDYCDTELLISGVVDSLKTIARSRGVDLKWVPIEETLPILLNLPATRRYLMDLLLELFDRYTDITLKVSSRSLISDSSVWLDLVISRQRPYERYDISRSDAMRHLTATLRESGGDLLVLDQQADNLTMRLEWALAFKG